MLAALPAAGGAGADDGNQNGKHDPAQVAAVVNKLEVLHSRVVAKRSVAEDNKYENPAPAWGAAVKPERAAELAVQAHGGGVVKSIARKKNALGRDTWEVTLQNHQTALVDVETEGVERREGQQQVSQSGE